MLLITDLDNTLYNWVDFHATSFEALVGALMSILDVERETLLNEFKGVHQSLGDSEQLNAVLELPTVKNHFQGMPSSSIVATLRPAFDAYENNRKVHLRLYPNVQETLEELCHRGIHIVAHTEARADTAYDRLERLEIRQYFRKLYALEGISAKSETVSIFPPHKVPVNFIKLVPASERKPNPRLLRDICSSEGFEVSSSWYVGDSIVRDISMAIAAGVHSIWAKYGTTYDDILWQALVRVTHWTNDDVAREAELKRIADGAKPDYVISDFSELLALLLP